MNIFTYDVNNNGGIPLNGDYEGIVIKNIILEISHISARNWLILENSLFVIISRRYVIFVFLFLAKSRMYQQLMSNLVDQYLYIEHA